MPRPLALPLACALALTLGASGCSRGADGDERRRIFSAGEGEAPAHTSAQPEGETPAQAVALGADPIAARIGSFEWSASVDWSVTRRGDDARRIHATEQHHVRQLATGEFAADVRVDGGRGPGGVTGRHVVHAGGTTWARGEFAPWRERPTDRGRDARLVRDESLGLAAEVLRLAGPALVVAPAGDAALLGRRAKAFALSLDPARFQPPAPVRPAAGGAPDDDTARRLAFLDGHEPRALTGELLLDDETGVPLRVKLSATFAVRDQPSTRVEVQLAQQLRAVGGAVGEVTPPKDPLPDARKPPGVAAALEAAGLKARPKAAEEKPEPEDDEER